MTSRILVIRGGAIGDFILTLPSLSALREKFPQARLEILGYPHVAALASCTGLAEAVRSIESPDLAPFFTRGSQLNPLWVDYFSSFDLIISYIYDPERLFETSIRRCSRAEFVAAAHRPQETEEVHATTFFLKALARIGIQNAPNTPRLELEMTPVPPNEMWVAAHPGSGSPRKNWPEEKWLELLDEILVGKKWNCLLGGGEAEGDRLQRFRAKLSSDRLHLAHHLPLVELARKFHSCTAFIGHDSGISHLAAAVGLPSLVLWGQTNETIWRPLGSRVKILRAGEKLAELQPRFVLAEFESVVRC